MVRYRDCILFMMPGTFTNRQHHIMLGDTQRFVVQHLRQVLRSTLRASHEDMFTIPLPDEIPVVSQVEIRRFQEMILFSW